MKLRTLNSKVRNIIFCLMIFFMLTACEDRQEGILSKNEMSDFLTDLHTLEGSLNAKGLFNANSEEENFYYNALLKKHGITQAIFDSSLVYYTFYPDKFEDIYDNVTEKLQLQDSLVKKLFYHPIDSVALRNMETEIWAKATKYEHKKDTAQQLFKFEVKNSDFLYEDRYSLSLLQRISPSSTKEKRKIILRVKYTNGVTDSVFAKAYNDSILRRYTLSIKAKRKLRIESISGSLLAGKTPNNATKILIDSVKLSRKYDSLAKDSINRILRRIEQPIKHADSLHIKDKYRIRNILLGGKKNASHK